VTSVPTVIRNQQTRSFAPIRFRHEAATARSTTSAIVADAKPASRPLNFELIKAMIEAGASRYHLETSSPPRRMRTWRQVIVPIQYFIQKLIACDGADVMLPDPHRAARLARATMLLGDVDKWTDTSPANDGDGYYRVRNGLRLRGPRRSSTRRTSTSSGGDVHAHMGEAREFAKGSREVPGKMLAYNCFAVVQLEANLDTSRSEVQDELPTWATSSVHHLGGFHTLNASMFELGTAIPQA